MHHLLVKKVVNKKTVLYCLNFRAFYGDCASPDRFLAAVQSVVDACIDLDSLPVLKEDPGLKNIFITLTYLLKKDWKAKV